jgi:hypothetical protein
MIIQRKESIDEEDGKLGFIETIFESSNILMSIYFAKNNLLYLSFSYGQTYRYDNVSRELYDQFENSESQGKFFNENIKNKSDIPYQKAFKLYESELIDAKKVIKEWKDKNQK